MVLSNCAILQSFDIRTDSVTACEIFGYPVRYEEVRMQSSQALLHESQDRTELCARGPLDRKATKVSGPATGELNAAGELCSIASFYAAIIWALIEQHAFSRD